MGLDAVVYKHRSKLPADPERAGLQIEPETGEWYSASDQLPEAFKSAGVEALHQRLGNVSVIAALNSRVSALLPGDSILLACVLYNGTHSGDVISLEKIGALRQELSILRGSRLSPELAELLDSLYALVEAAEENSNPIVFV